MNEQFESIICVAESYLQGVVLLISSLDVMPGGPLPCPTCLNCDLARGTCTTCRGMGHVSLMARQPGVVKLINAK